MRITFDRARQAHLLRHPEEATPDDVRAMLGSLQEMRRAAVEVDESGGGCVVIVRLAQGEGAISVKFCAPHMDDERLERVTLKMVERLVRMVGGEA